MAYQVAKLTQMFGTLPEPLFNHNLCGVSPEMLQDWINVLSMKNAQTIDSAKPAEGVSFMHDSVQFLFLTCETFKMSSQVKYLGLELFDRFMIKHIQGLHQHVCNSIIVKNRKKEWQEILKRVTKQVVLRIVSCVQIASKLTFHYNVLMPNRARRFLLECGHRYNTESIIQSELRVLKTLDFCVYVPSTLVYMESLLEILGQMDVETEVKVLHGVSQFLLDMVYLHYNEVYTRLHQLVSAGSPITKKDRDRFASVRADKTLLTVTLITTAAYIVYRDSYEKVMNMLSKVANIPFEDITDFASVILQVLMGRSED